MHVEPYNCLYTEHREHYAYLLAAHMTHFRIRNPSSEHYLRKKIKFENMTWYTYF